MHARSGTRLDGTRLRVVRLVWLALTAFSVVMFAVGLPAYVAALHSICTGDTCPTVQLSPQGAQAVERIGLTLNTYAALLIVDTFLVVLVFCTVGGVIAWRRSDDWLALLVSYMLVAMGTALVFANLVVASAGWRFLDTLASFLGYAPALFFVRWSPPRWQLPRSSRRCAPTSGPRLIAASIGANTISRTFYLNAVSPKSKGPETAG